MALAALHAAPAAIAEVSPLDEFTAVTIATATGLVTILADVYGDCAAHEAWQGAGGWVVTHVPTGLTICRAMGGEVSQVEADIIARVLGAQVPAPTEQAGRDATDRILAVIEGALSCRRSISAEALS